VEPQRQERFEAVWRTTVIVCGAIVAAVPVMLVVAFLMQPQPAEEPSLRVMLLAFALVGVVSVAASFFAGRWMREASISAARARAAQAGAPFSRADALPGVMLVSCVVPFALAEVPVLVGFTYHAMSGSWPVLLGFAGLTLLGYAINFPRASTWRRLIDEAEALDAGYAPIVS